MLGLLWLWFTDKVPVCCCLTLRKIEACLTPAACCAQALKPHFAKLASSSLCKALRIRDLSCVPDTIDAEYRIACHDRTQ